MVLSANSNKAPVQTTEGIMLFVLHVSFKRKKNPLCTEFNAASNQKGICRGLNSWLIMLILYSIYIFFSCSLCTHEWRIANLSLPNNYLLQWYIDIWFCTSYRLFFNVSHWCSRFTFLLNSFKSPAWRQDKQICVKQRRQS